MRFLTRSIAIHAQLPNRTMPDAALRRRQLVIALRTAGLGLRSDSSLCDQYIAFGAGNVPSIVAIMGKMNLVYASGPMALRFEFSNARENYFQSHSRAPPRRRYRNYDRYDRYDRYGEYDDYGDYDDFTPKIAGLWQPTDWLSLRASYSEAYIVPTLTQQFASETSFLQTTTDPIFLDSQATFRTNSYAGNQDLQPESADVYNIGASLSLFDGTLRFSVDYSDYDFSDRISRTTAQQVIDVDNTNFLNFYGLDNNLQATEAQQQAQSPAVSAAVSNSSPSQGAAAQVPPASEIACLRGGCQCTS